jgi:aldose 1-epimerase
VSSEIGGGTVFGTLPGGEPVEAFTLRSSGGVEAQVIAFGGAIVSLRVPDREGRVEDVVLGYDSLEGYLADDAYFGALIGRYANRIRGGRFSLDGVEHALDVNNGPNHLHGGRGGFHKVLWKAEQADGALTLSHSSADGEQGYPGALHARVTYRLTDANELVVDYAATAERPTPVNLTQHSYFNLTGDPTRDILSHELQVEADFITPVDATLISTGELRPVEGTAFDFRRPTPIGARIADADAQLAHAGGYDHNFVLRRNGAGPSLAARVHDPSSGRTLEVLTTEPGIQFYSGNFLDGAVRGKNGVRYAHRCGLCLEPQHFPDSPNHPTFPSVILRPGERYTSRTVYRFLTD